MLTRDDLFRIVNSVGQANFELARQLMRREHKARGPEASGTAVTVRLLHQRLRNCVDRLGEGDVSR